MQRWWGRAVAATSSVMVVAGLVAAGASAVEADRSGSDPGADAAVSEAAAAPGPAQSSGSTPAASPAPPAPPAPPGPPGPLDGRPVVPDTVAGVEYRTPAGWAPAETQDVVPVPPERFSSVLTLGERAVVMVGTLDPARAPAGDDAALGREAGRLVAAFADGTAPDADRVRLSDAAERLDGRAAWTSLVRTEGGSEDTPENRDGALVRVTTIAGPPRGVVALAVVLASPTRAADAAAAEDVVRSLRFTGPPEGSPEPAAPVRSPEPAPTGR